MHSAEREPIESATAGNIVAVVGVKNVRTGDTLCKKGAEIVYEQIRFADPVISLAIETENTRDGDKLATALAKLNHEDPTFQRSKSSLRSFVESLDRPSYSRTESLFRSFVGSSSHRPFNPSDRPSYYPAAFQVGLLV